MLTSQQKAAILRIYETLEVPSDRLPYSPQMVDLASQVSAAQVDVWKFLLHCRNPKGQSRRRNKTFLPPIDGRTKPKRIPLSAQHAEVIATELADVVNKAEHFIYSDAFLQFVSAHPERTANEWAYDLIRYRKAQYREVKSVKRDRITEVKPSVFSGPPNATLSLGEQGMKLELGQVAPPPVYSGPIVAIANDGHLYIGPSPLPPTCTLLGKLRDDQARKLQAESHTDKLAKFWYRATTAYVDYLRDEYAYTLDIKTTTVAAV